MATKTGKDITFQVDNASNAITEITSSCNSASLSAALSAIEDTALGDGEQTFVHGVEGATMSINGFWNTTTEPIFGPLIGNWTGTLKTVEYGDGVKYFNGEAIVTNVQVSGSVNSVETFSADFQITGAMNRTSVKLS